MQYHSTGIYHYVVILVKNTTPQQGKKYSITESSVHDALKYKGIFTQFNIFLSL